MDLKNLKIKTNLNIVFLVIALVFFILVLGYVTVELDPDELATELKFRNMAP